MRRNFLRCAAAVGGGGALGLGACADDSTDGDTTTGQRVTLTTTIGLSATTFTNAIGWQITLTRALLSVGALRYFTGEPLESAGVSAPPSESLGERLGKLLGLGIAHAHPGHYKPGDARGEMLQATSLDLVPGPHNLPDGVGITGLFRSARFEYGVPPTGESAAVLGDHVVLIELTAMKDAAVRHVILGATNADVLDAEGLPYVEGCTFEEVTVATDGHVTVTVDAEVWFDQADFTDLAEGDAPVVAPPESAAFRAFARGLKKAGAFYFVYSTT